MITTIKDLLELRTLRKNVWLSEKELKRIQEQKLKILIRHAYENVIYYRNLLNSVGIKPEHIKGTEDLSKIPITTKETIKETPIDELLARGVDKERCIKETTSGSTGKPLTVYLDRKEKQHRKLRWLRAYFENGYSITDKVISIWRPMGFEKKSKFRKIGILDFDYISVFLPLEEQVELLKRARPDVIYSTKSALELLSKRILKEEMEIERPKSIFSTGEVLDDATREIINDAFGVNPTNVYASNEMGMLAWECSAHRGLHINADCVVTEFIDRGGKPVSPGEKGVTICTNLYSYTMPFIRYKLDDACVLCKEMCRCGRQFPLIESIEGRLDDIVSLSDGSLLNFQFFFNFMKNYSEIDQYRIIQEDWEHIRVILLCKEEYFKKTVDRLKSDFRALYIKGVNVSFERVRDIPLESSGKRRSIISKVKPDSYEEDNEAIFSSSSFLRE
jgi:phenylacetate-CoA ligase